MISTDLFLIQTIPQYGAVRKFFLTIRSRVGIPVGTHYDQDFFPAKNHLFSIARGVSLQVSRHTNKAKAIL